MLGEDDRSSAAHTGSIFGSSSMLTYPLNCCTSGNPLSIIYILIQANGCHMFAPGNDMLALLRECT